jgi:hypothetical protein
VVQRNSQKKETKQKNENVNTGEEPPHRIHRRIENEEGINERGTEVTNVLFFTSDADKRGANATEAHQLTSFNRRNR